MSWAAHDLEPYSIQRHLGIRVAFIPLLIGSYSPDILTKWFVYGINVFGVGLKADQPQDFHRGWPGIGFTHSLFFGIAIALIIYAVSHSRIWAISFMIGQWAHALTDTGDTMGTMLFFPLSLDRVSLGAWQYAGQTGRYVDAAAYYSGLGWVWDGVWVVVALFSWRVITRDYFYNVVAAADGTWGWLLRRIPEEVVISLYRASYFYGITRWVAWLIWAHVIHDYSFDLSWGGPDWVVEHMKTLNYLFGPGGCPICSAPGGGCGWASAGGG